MKKLEEIQELGGGSGKGLPITPVGSGISEGPALWKA